MEPRGDVNPMFLDDRATVRQCRQEFTARSRAREGGWEMRSQEWPFIDAGDRTLKRYKFNNTKVL